MIPGIVLAAGASSRMGRPKALLPADGRTFIAAIIHALQHGGAAPVVVVIRPGASDVGAEATRAGAAVVVNPSADDGQLSSLVCGLAAIDDGAVPAAIVTLVDVPLVRAGTTAALFARLSTSAAPILRATYRGRHGHPVLFRRTVFDALRAADPAIGAKAVLGAYAIEDVEVDDPGVVEDVDTPEDYARLFGGRP